MSMDLNVQLYVVTILTIVGIIHFILRKKPNEPENDERTQKIAGKAALNTIVVIMGTLGVHWLGLHS